MSEVVGRATRIGWKRRKSGDKFEVVIELDAAPGWPINVVWDEIPIMLQLLTVPLEDDRSSSLASDQ